jgi:hypothetical protein
MKILLMLAVGFAVLTALPVSTRAQGVPFDCMASFKVKNEKITTDISWTLATGRSAALSCSVAEMLREKLFIEGDKVLKDSELTGTPAIAQQRAVNALNDLEGRIKQLPGDDVPGTLFSAGGYLVSKYLLASCLLTVEAGGGACWGAAASFIGATTRFFQKLHSNENNKLAKQELLSEIQKIKPALTSFNAGQADQAGARARWIQTQTNLCRAIQRDCL